MHALDLLINYPVFRPALVAAIAIATVCSVLSVIVVLKRMAFVGEGVAHAGYGGVGTALFLGLAGASQDIVILVFCLATGLAIGVLSRRKHVEPDSAIGIVLVAAMAWGVLMSDLRRSFQHSAWYIQHIGIPQQPPSAEALLFGSIITVGYANAAIAVVAAVVILALCAAFAKEIIFYAFDESSAPVFGVPTRMIHYLLLTLLSVAIVVGVRLAGFILVGALLVIPGATALLLFRRLASAMAAAWVVAIIGAVGGLLLSLELGDISTGPCIVGILCTLFMAAYIFRGIHRRFTTSHN